MPTAIQESNKQTLSPSEHDHHERLFTFKEAMAHLRVSRSTIYRLMSSCQLIRHKVGSQWRHYRSDLRACVRSQ